MDFGRGRMVFTFKNRIAERTSQSAGWVIAAVLYKALWHSNQCTQWVSKSWGRGRGSDDSSRRSETPGQWPAQAGCAMILVPEHNCKVVPDECYLHSERNRRTDVQPTTDLFNRSVIVRANWPTGPTDVVIRFLFFRVRVSSLHYTTWTAVSSRLCLLLMFPCTRFISGFALLTDVMALLPMHVTSVCSFSSVCLHIFGLRTTCPNRSFTVSVKGLILSSVLFETHSTCCWLCQRGIKRPFELQLAPGHCNIQMEGLLPHRNVSVQKGHHQVIARTIQMTAELI
jgi:hypothetical protein